MRRLLSLTVGIATTLAVAIPAVQILSTPAANATEMGGLSAAVSSSWQTNATVWKMAYGNGDIWMVGDFTTLRPPGDALGTGEQPADYFAALKASTGAVDPAIDDTHTFAGQPAGSLPLTNGSVAVSPDGSTVYVGGSFTSVDGQPRDHVAAFSTTTGALTSWNPDAGGPVSAIATSGDVVYLGGAFAKVGGVARADLAAVSFDRDRCRPVLGQRHAAGHRQHRGCAGSHGGRQPGGRGWLLRPGGWPDAVSRWHDDLQQGGHHRRDRVGLGRRSRADAGRHHGAARHRLEQRRLRLRRQGRRDLRRRGVLRR